MYNVVIGMITVDRHFPAHMPSLSTLAIQWQTQPSHSSYSLTLEQAQRLLRLQHTQCWGCPPASRTAHPHALARGGRLALVAVVVTHAPPAQARTHTRTRQRYTTARTPTTRIRHPEHSFRTFLLRFLGTTSTRSQPPPPAPTANGEGSRQSRVGSGKEGGGEKPRAPHSPGNTACVPGLTPRSRASQPPRCEASATPRVCRGTGHPPLAPRVHG